MNAIELEYWNVEPTDRTLTALRIGASDIPLSLSFCTKGITVERKGQVWYSPRLKAIVRCSPRIRDVVKSIHPSDLALILEVCKDELTDQRAEARKPVVEKKNTRLDKSEVFDELMNREAYDERNRGVLEKYSESISEEAQQMPESEGLKTYEDKTTVWRKVAKPLGWSVVAALFCLAAGFAYGAVGSSGLVVVVGLVVCTVVAVGLKPVPIEETDEID